MQFGMDWVTREARHAGMSREQAWSMGSLHRHALQHEARLADWAVADVLTCAAQ